MITTVIVEGTESLRFASPDLAPSDSVRACIDWIEKNGGERTPLLIARRWVAPNGFDVWILRQQDAADLPHTERERQITADLDTFLASPHPWVDGVEPFTAVDGRYSIKVVALARFRTETATYRLTVLDNGEAYTLLDDLSAAEVIEEVRETYSNTYGR